MLIHTSNIINWKSIKNNPHLTSTDELLKCSIQVIKCCSKHENIFESNKLSNLEIDCVRHKDVILDDRSDLRINVKLFLLSPNYQEIQKFLSQIFKYLEVKQLDSLIVSIAPDSTLSQICMHDFYDLWTKLGSYVKDHRILQLGVCDFTLEQLENMWLYAEIKPSINQIYSKLMCSVSQALKEFAAEHHIQLLSHDDRPDILPGHQFKTMFQEIVPNLIIESVEPIVVCRYSIIYKNRSVIRSKGYISKIVWN